MTESKEKKAGLRNFKFRESINAMLEEESKRTGRSMTLILEDKYLLKRQFRDEIEHFLDSEESRTGKSRKQIIEAALALAEKEFKERNRLELNQPSSTALSADEQRAFSGAPSISHQSQLSPLGQNTASPSGSKYGPAYGKRRRPKK